MSYIAFSENETHITDRNYKRNDGLGPHFGSRISTELKKAYKCNEQWFDCSYASITGRAGAAQRLQTVD